MHNEIITNYGNGFRYPGIQENDEAKEEEKD